MNVGRLESSDDESFALKEEGSVGSSVSTKSTAEDNSESSLSSGSQPSLIGEWGNISLLLALYFLQGIPIGLASSIPMLLLSKGASYSDQALFSLSSWPYSLKWAWAPIVDALYTSVWGLGRRKSWIIPCQLVTGLIMMLLAARIDDLLLGGTPNVPGLLVAFLCLYFLVATQDIAVDGWALTLLRPENVGYASTANTVGQGVGIQVAFSLLLNLDSADVCNTYIRPALGLSSAPTGILSLGGFLWGWGLVFIVVTLLVWVLQKEGSVPHGGYTPLSTANKEVDAVEIPAAEAKPARNASSQAITAERFSLRLRAKSNSRSGSEEGEKSAAGTASKSGNRIVATGADGESLQQAITQRLQPPSPIMSSVFESYRDFFNVCFLPNVLLLSVVLFSVKAGFSTVDSTTNFVLQNRGVPKETLAFIDTLSFPLQLCIQIFFLAQLTAGPQSLSLFLWAFPLRVLSGLLLAASVYWLPNRTLDPFTTSSIPFSYVALLFLVSNIHSIVQSVQFMSQMSFFSRVASQSPSNGATIMTLLNALSNLGSMWPRPLVLLALESLSEKSCIASGGNSIKGGAACHDSTSSEKCKELGGMCATLKDGYPIIVAAGVVYCVLWWVTMRSVVERLQKAPSAGWKLGGGNR